jgi:hypothetical protein
MIAGDGGVTDRQGLNTALVLVRDVGSVILLVGWIGQGKFGAVSKCCRLPRL